ncbi:MAG: response regulator [Clostridia bacterium]|nr:response regulator [Clostridia bacterium]
MSYKVLIVDDEITICRGLEKYISKFFCEFSVIATLNSGEEAMDYIRSHEVDLVLSDIKMLGVSGLDLAKMIYEEYPHIQVILISGYSNFDYAKQAIQYHVVDYLTKPINFQELKMRLEETIKRFKSTENNKKAHEKMDFVKTVFNCGNMLLKGLLNGDMSLVTEGIEAMTAFSPTLEYTEEDKAHLCNLCDVILQSLEQNNIQIDKNYGLGYFQERLNRIKTNKEVREFLMAYFNQLADNNINLEEERDKMIIFRAKRFIERNYSKEISAGDVAEYVGISTAYFSRLFHKVLHQTFVDYVTNLRITQSEKLLKESNYKIIEISEMVGFRSNTYFNSLFKKKTGMTPIEYRKYFKDSEV